MQQVGSRKREAESKSGEEVVAPKKLMASDLQVTLNEMQTVMDLQKLLQTTHSNVSTTRLVFEKTLSLCGLPRSTDDLSTGEAGSTEEVQSEQENLQRQLDALKKKKAETVAVLEEQRKKKARQEQLRRILNDSNSELPEIEAFLDNRNVRIQLADQLLQFVKRGSAILQKELDVLVLPLRED